MHASRTCPGGSAKSVAKRGRLSRSSSPMGGTARNTSSALAGFAIAASEARRLRGNSSARLGTTATWSLIRSVPQRLSAMHFFASTGTSLFEGALVVTRIGNFCQSVSRSTGWQMAGRSTEGPADSALGRVQDSRSGRKRRAVSSRPRGFNRHHPLHLGGRVLLDFIHHPASPLPPQADRSLVNWTGQLTY